MLLASWVSGFVARLRSCMRFAPRVWKKGPQARMPHRRNRARSVAAHGRSAEVQTLEVRTLLSGDELGLNQIYLADASASAGVPAALASADAAHPPLFFDWWMQDRVREEGGQVRMART